MTISSIKFSLTGSEIDWMMNTSSPRTLSLILIWISPSLKCLTDASQSSTPISSAIFSANSWFELSAKSLIPAFSCMSFILPPSIGIYCRHKHSLRIEFSAAHLQSYYTMQKCAFVFQLWILSKNYPKITKYLRRHSYNRSQYWWTTRP